MGTIGSYVLDELKKLYPVKEIDVGPERKLDKNGMHFTVQRYYAEGLGNVCILDMTGMMGLMKMETVVVAAKEKDVPLVNLDGVVAMGKRTDIVEFYDTVLEHRDDALLRACEALRDADRDIPDQPESGPHWFDSLLYPCRYGKKTKKNETRTVETSKRYFDAFIKEAARCTECDVKAKEAKNRAFAEGLLNNGGPAVDQVRKLFGEETTRRLVLNHMYGAE